MFDWIKRRGRPKGPRLEAMQDIDQVEDAFSPLPGDFGNEDGEEAPIRHAIAWCAVGTAEELDQIRGYVNGLDDGSEFNDDEADMARDALLEELHELEATPTFSYDMAGSIFSADNGEDVDVYVVRGDKEALARFNESVAAVGGECASVGLDGVTIAADALANLIRSECEWREGGAEEMLAKADRLADQAAQDLGLMELDARIGKLEAKRSRGYLKQRELDELIDYRVAQRLMNHGLAEINTVTASLEELGFGAFTPDDLVAWKNAVAKNHSRLLVWTPFRPEEEETARFQAVFHDLRGNGASVSICQGLNQSREVAEIKEWAQEQNEKQADASPYPSEEACRAEVVARGYEYHMVEWLTRKAASYAGSEVVAEQVDAAVRYFAVLSPQERYRIMKGQGVPPTFAEAEPAPKHRSPCYRRRRERQKFGVRKAQLLKLGGKPDQAAYISDRVKHMQRQGVGMVEAIEQAQTEWLVKDGQWDGLDLFNRRREAGLTVPRLVVEGYGSEHAQFLIARVDYFGSEGVPFSEALNWAHYLWEAKQSGEAVEIRAARDRIGGWLRSARVQQIVDQIAVEDASEEMSGAAWIAEVAADLREEWNCKTSARFTKEEALAQAWSEWRNMAPAARWQVRVKHNLDCGVEDWSAKLSASAEEAQRFPVIEDLVPAFTEEVLRALASLMVCDQAERANGR